MVSIGKMEIWGMVPTDKSENFEEDKGSIEKQNSHSYDIFFKISKVFSDSLIC